jgi:hypothetical protein
LRDVQRFGDGATLVRGGLRVSILNAPDARAFLADTSGELALTYPFVAADLPEIRHDWLPRSRCCCCTTMRSMPDDVGVVPVEELENPATLRPVADLTALVRLGCSADVLSRLLARLAANDAFRPVELTRSDFLALSERALRLSRDISRRPILAADTEPERTGAAWDQPTQRDLSCLAADVKQVAEVLRVYAGSCDARGRVSRRRGRRSSRAWDLTLGRLIGYVRLISGRACNREIADLLNERFPTLAEPYTEEGVRLWARSSAHAHQVWLGKLWTIGRFREHDETPPMEPGTRPDLVARIAKEAATRRLPPFDGSALQARD